MALKFVPGNALVLLKNGEQYFPALVEAFDSARAEIFFETYIFADDETGSLVCDALARAAARGVASGRWRGLLRRNRVSSSVAPVRSGSSPAYPRVHWRPSSAGRASSALAQMRRFRAFFSGRVGSASSAAYSVGTP